MSYTLTVKQRPLVPRKRICYGIIVTCWNCDMVHCFSVKVFLMVTSASSYRVYGDPPDGSRYLVFYPSAAGDGSLASAIEFLTHNDQAFMGNYNCSPIPLLHLNVWFILPQMRQSGITRLAWPSPLRSVFSVLRYACWSLLLFHIETEATKSFIVSSELPHWTIESYLSPT